MTKVINRANGVAVVEWQDDDQNWRRTAVPEEDIDLPERGIDLGATFADLIDVGALPYAIDNELKRRGVWGFEDVEQNVGAVRSAIIQATTSIVLQQLLQLAKSSRREKSND